MATFKKTATGGIKAQVYLRKGPGGMPSRTFETLRQAKAWATELESKRNRGEVVSAPSSTTVGAFWIELEKTRLVTLTKNSTDRDASHWRCHLAPRWAAEKIVDVRRPAVQAWVSEALAAGMGQPTAKGCIELLSAIFEAAIDAELVVANPAMRIKLPRHEARSPGWIEPSDVDAIVANVSERNPTIGCFLELLAHTGLRYEEAAGLLRRNVDTRANQIRVRTVVENYRIRDYPKTAGSRRDIPIPTELRGRLLALVVGDPDGPVFTGARGGLLDDRALNRRFLAPACEAVGVPRLTLHNLRHAYCSWMAAAGMDFRELAKLVGHSSTRMLESRYAHLRPGINDRATETLAAALASGRQKSSAS